MIWDAVVIGAGANGLTAAACLARARRRVLVLERRADLGDTALAGWIPPRVVTDLGLRRHGLEIAAPDPWAAAPLPAGGRLELWRNVGRSSAAIAHLSTADARRWPEFCERMHRLARFLERLYLAAPPLPATAGLGNLLGLALLGGRVRALGTRGMVDLLRLLPMSAAELLDDWFESDALKGVLGAGAVSGIRQGPRSGGTAFVLLHHHVGSPPGVFRPATVGAAPFAAAARAAGVEIRCGAGVARVAARDGRATGVVLGSGEEIAARLVLSSADPRHTFLHLVEPGLLDPDFVRAVEHIKFRGTCAQVSLALADPPPFTTLCISPSLDYAERAYDAAKYGRISEHPWLEARAAGRDAAGRHRVALHVQYTPYRLDDGGWDEARRDRLGEAAVQMLDHHFPGVAAGVVAREVLTPQDLEELYGTAEGNLSHGELTLDQILFMRPVPGWAHYRTPVPGLYLCGAGAHPGPGVLGGPGALAARAALKDS